MNDDLIELFGDDTEPLENYLSQEEMAVFFELDEEEDEEWMAAGLFVAWQRTTQKVLQELMQE